MNLGQLGLSLTAGRTGNAGGQHPAVPVLGSLVGGATSVTNPMVASGSVAVALNDLVVCVFCEQSSSILATGCTDNLGNTYTAFNAGGTNSTTSARMFYTIVTAAGTLTAVNVACTASTNDASVQAVAFQGPFSAIDANPAIRTDGNSPMTGTATGTLNQAFSIVIGMMGSTSTGATITATTGWTLAGGTSTTGLRRASVCYQNVSATTSVTPSFDVSNGTDTTVVQTASFKRSA